MEMKGAMLTLENCWKKTKENERKKENVSFKKEEFWNLFIFTFYFYFWRLLKNQG